MKNIIRILWVDKQGVIYQYTYRKPHSYRELKSYFKRRLKTMGEDISSYRVCGIELVNNAILPYI